MNMRLLELLLTVGAVAVLAACTPSQQTKPDQAARGTPKSAAAQAAPETIVPTTPVIDTEALRLKAEDAYKNARWREAADAYKQLSEIHSTNTEYWFRLGNSLARLDDTPGAVTAYRTALRLKPNQSKVWHNMGVIQLRDAARSFAQLLGRSSEDDPLHEKARHYSLGLSAVLDARTDSTRTAQTLTRPETQSAQGAAPVTAAVTQQTQAIDEPTADTQTEAANAAVTSSLDTPEQASQENVQSQAASEPVLQHQPSPTNTEAALSAAQRREPEKAVITGEPVQSPAETDTRAANKPLVQSDDQPLAKEVTAPAAQASPQSPNIPLNPMSVSAGENDPDDTDEFANALLREALDPISQGSGNP